MRHHYRHHYSHHDVGVSGHLAAGAAMVLLLAVACRIACTPAESRDGSMALSIATIPATNGADMLVPASTACTSPGTSNPEEKIDSFADNDEMIAVPGAAISGLVRPSRVGPGLENEAMPCKGCGVTKLCERLSEPNQSTRVT